MQERILSNQGTEVRLLSVPLEKNYNHTLYFTQPAEQTNYFSSLLPSITIPNCSYQRKDGFIRFPRHIDDLRHYNYVMFKNPLRSKWFYGFITRMEYKSDEVTWIYFDIDVMQTYLFDYRVRASFVEREHAKDDTYGANTYPENLEVGEFVSHYTQVDSTLTDLSIVMGVTEQHPTIVEEWGEGPTFLGRYNGCVSGIRYVGYYMNELEILQGDIEAYDEAAKADAIQCLFVAPTFLASREEMSEGGENVQRVLESSEPASFEISIGGAVATTIAGSYKPRNKKLLSFPYKYLMVSNNAGASAIYHYENFNAPMSGMKFKVYGALTPGCSIRLLPENYKGVDENNEEGLNLGKFPICNWTSDVYTNWLTQNAVNIGLNVVSGVGQIVAGGAVALGAPGLGTAVGGGSIVGGVSTIANQLTQIHQMKMTPDQSRGNINSGDVTTSMHHNTFTFYGMSIKVEYARIIDEFFDMFGYKTNRVKVPERNHRENYWYTKTIDASIYGNIPEEDLDKIRACYNRGITFWKDGSKVGDYSVSNNTV